MRFGLLIWVVFAVACTGKKDKRGYKATVKLEQYLMEGRNLYLANCSNCHQPEGQGLAKLYPPLHNSDFMRDNLEETICIIKNGLQGEIVVNGVSYNQVMPANPQLTNLEVAEITTYIYNHWGHERGLIGVLEVEKVLSNCPQ